MCLLGMCFQSKMSIVLINLIRISGRCFDKCIYILDIPCTEKIQISVFLTDHICYRQSVFILVYIYHIALINSRERFIRIVIVSPCRINILHTEKHICRMAGAVVKVLICSCVEAELAGSRNRIASYR